MKKVFLWICLLVILSSLMSCGIKEKIETKAAEAVGEKLLKGAGDDVDIDGDQIKIKGKDGEEMIIGGTEWPDSELAKAIPEFKKGKITAVVKTEEGLMITVEEVKAEDFTPYLEDIKSKYTENTYETESAGAVTYGGADTAGITVYLCYTEDEKNLIINAAKVAVEE